MSTEHTKTVGYTQYRYDSGTSVHAAAYTFGSAPRKEVSSNFPLLALRLRVRKIGARTVSVDRCAHEKAVSDFCQSVRAHVRARESGQRFLLHDFLQSVHVSKIGERTRKRSAISVARFLLHDFLQSVHVSKIGERTRKRSAIFRNR